MGPDGDSPMRPGGVSTGRMRVGRFTILVGEPAGTIVTVVRDAAPQPPPELVDALSTLDTPRVRAAGQVQEAVEQAAEVTSRIERAVELFTLVAQGRLDAAAASKELDALLDLLRRLDRAGRFDEALRLVRPLQGLLALTLRWVSLVEALHIALDAAEALANVDAQAWVRHELGSLGLGAEDAHAAEAHLSRARELREQAGDSDGLRATQHNLTTLRAGFAGGRWSTRTPVIAGATVLALVIVAFVLAPSLDDATDVDTKTTVATIPATTTTAPSLPPSPSPPPPADVTAPRVTITTPQEGSVATATGPTVVIAGTAGSAPDDADTVRLTVHEGSRDGPAAAGPFNVTRDGPNWEKEVTLPLDPDARLKYTAVATQQDEAGNTSRPDTVTFIGYVPPIDPPPTPRVTVPPPPPPDVPG